MEFFLEWRCRWLRCFKLVTLLCVSLLSNQWRSFFFLQPYLWINVKKAPGVEPRWEHRRSVPPTHQRSMLELNLWIIYTAEISPSTALLTPLPAGWQDQCSGVGVSAVISSSLLPWMRDGGARRQRTRGRTGRPSLSGAPGGFFCLFFLENGRKDREMWRFQTET